MGGALATLPANVSFGKDKILDVATFRVLATEYDKLKALGMSIEGKEIYQLSQILSFLSPPIFI